jgi:uncharacterized protein (TIGR00290 family)
VSWSSGKDGAFALWEARHSGALEIVGLLTTLTTPFTRVSMHGVPEALLERQVAELGLPCKKVGIPFPCSNERYEEEMVRVLAEAAREGVSHVVFGDLFLEDVRRYREERLATVGFEAVFPLWGRDTRALALEMIEVGVRATIACVDPRKLPRSFAGREFDAALLRDLPDGVDPCGENGEFHTFVSGGPMFRAAIDVRVQGVVEREGFVFADLVAA